MQLLGQIRIELGGKSYDLRPTFEGLLVLEDRANKTLSEVFDNFVKGKVGVRDISAVIYAGLYGANGNKNPSMSYEEIGNLVIQAGVASFPQCGYFVAAAYSGKPLNELGEAGDVEEKKTI
jgi:hypothetical protein